MCGPSGTELMFERVLYFLEKKTVKQPFLPTLEAKDGVKEEKYHYL